MADHHDHNSHGTMGQLMTGLALAAILTIIPFVLVMSKVAMDRTMLIGIIMVLAAVQIVVHLVYFLHVNRQTEQGWTVAGTVLAVVLVAIIIIGSLWVMHNMNVNMMPMDDAAHQGMDMSGMNMQGMDHSKMQGMNMPATQPAN